MAPVWSWEEEGVWPGEGGGQRRGEAGGRNEEEEEIPWLGSSVSLVRVNT